VTNHDITIGVSSCLLGHTVRYDGKHKYHSLIATRLCEEFHCLPLCPEYAIGLGVPRKPIQLVQITNVIHAVGIEDNSDDVTTPLQAYADFVHRQFPMIRGYVFKARSPSCGVESSPVFWPDGTSNEMGSGVYSQHLRELVPDLPVVEETALTTENSIEQFIRAVRRYAAAVV
jgi:uncharacterized protein YbbK (DUF523 family)